MITIRCTWSRGPRGFFCLQVVRRGPVIVDVVPLGFIHTMFTRIFAAALVMIALPTLANSQTWTTPDGFLSVMPPNESEFQPMPNPPAPFVGLWVSDDETMKFGVMKTQIPPNIKLIQSSAEEGLAEEIGGKVTRLPTKRMAGHEVWNMTGKASSLEITQAMIQHDSSLYKLMAATIGSAPDADAANRFIDSLSIIQSSATPGKPSRRPDTQRAQDLGGGFDLHDLSKTIGGAGALLGIGLFVYFLTRNKTKRQM